MSTSPDSIKSMDKGNLNIKELALKAENCLFSTKLSRFLKRIGEITDNLNYLYRHIRFAINIH